MHHHRNLLLPVPQTGCKQDGCRSFPRPPAPWRVVLRLFAPCCGISPPIFPPRGRCSKHGLLIGVLRVASRMSEGRSHLSFPGPPPLTRRSILLGACKTSSRLPHPHHYLLLHRRNAHLASRCGP